MKEISTEDCPQGKPRFVFQIFFLIFLAFAIATAVLYFVLWDVTFVFLSVISLIMIPVTRQLAIFAADYNNKILLKKHAQANDDI
ncbi:MAG: hypothetical protein ABI954_06705 [Pyrinomonadaceae bacterium]